MDFFTSPEDLKGWVGVQPSADEAALRIVEIIGKNDEQDVVDTCKAIFNDENADDASKILFEVLAKHNLTQIKEGNMKDKLKKEAQLMRGEAPLYDKMPMRVCPKLPYSQGKRLISTYNCRHWCLDSLVLDDDPLRVYCAEALWRRHVMDKFSREFKDKEGKWVGGYINERFQVFHDDGGNQMELANDERTRKPRPHQYSIERRLSEGRGEETYDIEASKSNKFVKLASSGASGNGDDDHIHQIFSDIIEMKEAGLKDEDILGKISDHYSMTVVAAANIHKIAMKQLQRHDKVIYAQDNGLKKNAQLVNFPERSTIKPVQDVEVVRDSDKQKTILRTETPVVRLPGDPAHPMFEVLDGPDTGAKFTLSNDLDISHFGPIETENVDEMIQDGADELMLNEESVPVEKDVPAQETSQEEFPVVEI